MKNSDQEFHKYEESRGCCQSQSRGDSVPRVELRGAPCWLQSASSSCLSGRPKPCPPGCPSTASFQPGLPLWTFVWGAVQSPVGREALETGGWPCGVEAMASLQEKPREEGICPICQESLMEAVSTDCGHLFCRACLAQHVEKASASGVFGCPLCRKPCSEGVLGEGHICHSHQKKVSWFCEESRLLLCVECLVSPEHESHRELAIEDAIRHYKERLSRKSRKLRKDVGERLGAQAAAQLQVESGLRGLQAPLERPPGACPEQRTDGAEDQPAEELEALRGVGSLLTDLDRRAKDLGARTLGDASELLTRSAPQELEALHAKFQKRVDK